MQDIGISTNRPASVTRPDDPSRIDGGPRVYLEFRGLRDAPHVADKDTRIMIVMPVSRGAELRRQLAAAIPSQEEWCPQFTDILAQHLGEVYQGEDAVEMLQRLSDFWRENHPLKD
jgi:hypothetical protein